MLNLSADEQAWVDEFRRQMGEQFPGLLEDIIIFGPYSRGISDPEVDMFTLVLIKEGDRKKKQAVADLGYYVDLDTTLVSPTLMVRTMAEWEESKRKQGGIYQWAHDGVSAL
ncbi:MAG: hypothetical protein OXL37_08865 [Chloroflexota bacterium]|nr:hypothetical protein [Chloroflexota bacterium]MDE2959535.1 hypothetical protein [Chloroflexota bacterium]